MTAIPTGGIRVALLIQQIKIYCENMDAVLASKIQGSISITTVFTLFSFWEFQRTLNKTHL